MIGYVSCNAEKVCQDCEAGSVVPDGTCNNMNNVDEVGTLTTQMLEITMLRRVGDVDVDIMFCYEKQHNNQPRGLSIRQFYATNDVIICLRLELGHVHERLHNNSVGNQ